MRAVPPLCVLYPGICLTTEEKEHGKNLGRGSRKVPGGHDSICRNGRLLQVTGTRCRSWSPCFRGHGSKPISHIIRHGYINHRPRLLNSIPNAIKRVQVNQNGLKLNGTHQLLAYVDDVNILGGSAQSVKEKVET